MSASGDLASQKSNEESEVNLLESQGLDNSNQGYEGGSTSDSGGESDYTDIDAEKDKSDTQVVVKRKRGRPPGARNKLKGITKGANASGDKPEANIMQFWEKYSKGGDKNKKSDKESTSGEDREGSSSDHATNDSDGECDQTIIVNTASVATQTDAQTEAEGWEKCMKMIKRLEKDMILRYEANSLLLQESVADFGDYAMTKIPKMIEENFGNLKKDILQKLEKKCNDNDTVNGSESGETEVEKEGEKNEGKDKKTVNVEGEKETENVEGEKETENGEKEEEEKTKSKPPKDDNPAPDAMSPGELEREMLERKKRRANLKISGLRGSNKREVCKAFDNIAKQCWGAVPHYYDVVKLSSGEVVFQLDSVKTRRECMGRRHELQGAQVWIEEDNTLREEEVQRWLHREADRMRGKGIHVKVGYQKITWGNKMLKWNEGKGELEDVSYSNDHTERLENNNNFFRDSGTKQI